MTVEIKKDGQVMTVEVVGRVDTMTAPELGDKINDNIDNVTELYLDFAGVEYVSSAGLRVILSTQKTMNAKGKMVLTNVRPEVKEVFDITGFTDILTFE